MSSSGAVRILIGIALFLIAGCERKVDSPTNPDLKVTNVPIPSDLSAATGDRLVLLDWSVSASDSASVARFLIYRADSLSGQYRLLDSATWSPYSDANVANGVWYAYRISVRNRGGIEGNTSVALLVKPSFFSARINNDSAYTRSVDVRVELTAPAATLMRLANDTTAPGAWRTFQSVTNWTLEGGVGPKTVFAQFQIAGGTGSIGWVSDDIRLDDRAEITTVTVSDSVLAPGDSLLIFANAVESGGTATYSLGPVSGVRLFDDGLGIDTSAQDGVYSGTYRASEGQLFEQRALEVQFTDKAGNRAQALSAPWRISVRYPPEAPVWVSLLSVFDKPRVVSLTWSPLNAQSFSQLVLRRSLVPGQGHSAPVVNIFTNASQTTFNDTGLTAATTYYYTLDLVLQNGLAAISAESSVTTAVNLPPIAVTVAVEPTADSSLSLSWTRFTEGDFESYRVFQAENSAELNGTPSDSLLVQIITSASQTSYTQTGMTQLFYYRVFVYDQSGLSTGSNTVWGPRDFGP